jgi:hypothetical protein
MRAVGLLLLSWLCVASVGCKSKGDADSDGAPDPAALKAQQDLLARRDALLAMRTKLQGERDNVDAQIKEAEAKGGDTAELVKKKADLDSQIESSTSDLISIASSKLDATRQTLDKSAAIASREAEIATREKLVGEREARIAEREKQLIQRDSDLAQRWKDSCATGGTTTIIQQAPPAKGGPLPKKDISDLVAKGRANMAKKALLVGDLPGYAQNLDTQALDALKGDDTYKASVAAQNFVQGVDSVTVNHKFINEKMGRLNAAFRAKKMDDAKQQQLATINNDVGKLVLAGEFIAANKRLNQAAQMLE